MKQHWVVAFDFSTVSTGFAAALVGNKEHPKNRSLEIKLGSLQLTKEEKTLKGWPRTNAMVSKVVEQVNVFKSPDIEIYYEQANVFLNAFTVRSIMQTMMPILYTIECTLGLPTTPIQVMKARKRTLGKPPYKKDNVFQALKHVAKNNDESDAIAILLTHPMLINVKIDNITAKR